jgi:hypothetical protein
MVGGRGNKCLVCKRSEGRFVYYARAMVGGCGRINASEVTQLPNAIACLFRSVSQSYSGTGICSLYADLQLSPVIFLEMRIAIMDGPGTKTKCLGGSLGGATRSAPRQLHQRGWRIGGDNQSVAEAKQLGLPSTAIHGPQVPGDSN